MMKRAEILKALESQESVAQALAAGRKWAHKKNTGPLIKAVCAFVNREDFNHHANSRSSGAILRDALLNDPSQIPEVLSMLVEANATIKHYYALSTLMFAFLAPNQRRKPDVLDEAFLPHAEIFLRRFEEEVAMEKADGPGPGIEEFGKLFLWSAIDGDQRARVNACCLKAIRDSLNSSSDRYTNLIIWLGPFVMRKGIHEEVLQEIYRVVETPKIKIQEVISATSSVMRELVAIDPSRASEPINVILKAACLPDAELRPIATVLAEVFNGHSQNWGYAAPPKTVESFAAKSEEILKLATELIEKEESIPTSTHRFFASTASALLGILFKLSLPEEQIAECGRIYERCLTLVPNSRWHKEYPAKDTGAIGPITELLATVAARGWEQREDEYFRALISVKESRSALETFLPEHRDIVLGEIRKHCLNISVLWVVGMDWLDHNSRAEATEDKVFGIFGEAARDSVGEDGQNILNRAMQMLKLKPGSGPWVPTELPNNADALSTFAEKVGLSEKLEPAKETPKGPHEALNLFYARWSRAPGVDSFSQIAELNQEFLEQSVTNHLADLGRQDPPETAKLDYEGGDLSAQELIPFGLAVDGDTFAMFGDTVVRCLHDQALVVKDEASSIWEHVGRQLLEIYAKRENLREEVQDLLK